MKSLNTSHIRSRGRGFASIRGRLILLLLVILIPILLIQSFTLYDRFQNRKREQFQVNLETARAAARTFELFVGDIFNQQMVVGHALTHLLGTPDQMSLFLEQTQSSQGMVRNMAWLSPDGRVLASALPDLIGMDFSDRQYIQEILSGKNRIVSDLLQSRYDGKTVFNLVTGIRDSQGQLLGIVLSSVLPARLEELLGVERSRGGGITLGDSRGILVYRFPHAEIDWEMRQRYTGSLAVREALEGREAVEVIPASDFDGTKRFIAVTPIRSIGWVAGAGRVYDDVMQPIHTSIIRQVSLFGVVVLLSLLVAVLISRTITRPIQAIKGQLRTLETERFEPLPDGGGPTEIRDFSHAFNAVLSELHRMTTLLRAISEMTPNLLYVKDLESRMLYANPATLGTIGKSEKEVLGRSEAEWHRDPEQAAVILEDDRRVMESRMSATIEESFTSPAGARIFHTSKSPYLDENGRVIGVVGLSIDITEQKKAELELRESEERLSLALKTTQTGMFEWNVLTGKSRWTSQYESILGYPVSRDGSRSYREWADRVHPEDLPRVEERVRQAMTGQTPYMAEYRILWPDGSLRWAEGQGVFTYDSEGSPTRMLGTVRDITEHKRAEEALRRSLGEKTALLKEIHHRVKNNLQIVSSLLGLQSSRVNNHEIVDVLQDTRLRVRSMSLLHEMLYKSSNLARIDFEPYVRDLCGQLLLSYGAAAARVKVESRVSAVGLPLEQSVPCGLIVNELISNALKHAFPGERAGRITVAMNKADDNTLALTVLDDGVGLSVGLDPSKTPTLGFQLVSRLAAQLGGKLKMDRPDGGGTAIEIVFPVPQGMVVEELS